MKQSEEAAGQWLAMSIDLLMKRYPALRIAYIDTVASLEPEGKGVPMSVLLRWDEETEKVVEVYRVRLPDQRENDHGVVRPLASALALVESSRVMPCGCAFCSDVCAAASAAEGIWSARYWIRGCALR
jgi:hypothetical protein